MVEYKVIGGDRQEYGPATADEVREWIADGRLSGSSPVQVVGSEAWEDLAQRAEFFSALRAQAEAHGLALPAPPVPSREPGAPEPAGDLRIASCFTRAFGFLGEQGPVILVSSMIVGASAMFLQILPFVGPLYWVLKGVLYGGLSIVFLRLMRGQEATPADTFQGFHRNFGQLVLVGMVTSALTSLGLLLLLVPGIYFGVCWAFAIPLAADRGLEFWAAMELSRKTVKRIWFKVFVLLLIAFLPFVFMSIYTEIHIIRFLWPTLQEVWAGSGPPNLATLFKKLNEASEELVKTSAPLLVGTKVTLLFILPFAYGALMHAYEDLFGRRKPRPD